MCGVRQRRFPRTQSDQEPKTQTSLKKLEPERVWQQLIGYQNDLYTFITFIISQSRVKVKKLEIPGRIQVLFVHTVYYECIEMVPDVNQVVLNSDPRQISHVKAQTVWALHSKATIITKQPIIAKTT